MIATDLSLVIWSLEAEGDLAEQVLRLVLDSSTRFRASDYSRTVDQEDRQA